MIESLINRTGLLGDRKDDCTCPPADTSADCKLHGAKGKMTHDTKAVMEAVERLEDRAKMTFPKDIQTLCIFAREAIQEIERLSLDRAAIEAALDKEFQHGIDTKSDDLLDNLASFIEHHQKLERESIRRDSPEIKALVEFCEHAEADGRPHGKPVCHDPCECEECERFDSMKKALATFEQGGVK